jgi:hypothetical protein
VDTAEAGKYSLQCRRSVCAGRCVCRHSHDPRVREEAGRGSKSENRSNRTIHRVGQEESNGGDQLRQYGVRSTELPLVDYLGTGIGCVQITGYSKVFR